MEFTLAAQSLTTGTGVTTQVIDARDLHRALYINYSFSAWTGRHLGKRQEYEDYFVVPFQGANRTRFDYKLTLACAAHIARVTGSPEGDAIYERLSDIAAGIA